MWCDRGKMLVAGLLLLAVSSLSAENMTTEGSPTVVTSLTEKTTPLVYSTEDTTPRNNLTEGTTPGEVVTTEAPVWGTKPDCDEDPDRQFYPHTDCNKYWWCVSGEAQLMLCSPGTYFNPRWEFCDYPDNVDTSHCRVWVCEADGDMFAGAACNEFFECEHGQAVPITCAPGLYFNPVIERCDQPGNVDTSTCNVPLDQ